MSKERASLKLDNDLDLSEFQPAIKEKKEGRVDIEAVRKVAEQSGFPSREHKMTRRRRVQRSPYQSQAGIKCREQMKILFQELGNRLNIQDTMTFEQALLALIEKHGYGDLLERYRDTLR